MNKKRGSHLESAIHFLRMLYREHSSLNNFAVRDEQASPVPALLRSLYYIRPADTDVSQPSLNSPV